MFTLHTQDKQIKRHKRVGRGEGSNRGKNCGLGHKGQKKHGQGVRIGFEGGGKSLMRRQPKLRGFRQRVRHDIASLTLIQINRAFPDGGVVTLASLKEKEVIGKTVKKVKIINSGTLNKGITFEGEEINLTKGVKNLLNG